ncbi:MAG: glycosyltransferase [Clostridia bacterium]|nr:glycosyltransferase [Clostridia bacterium]
MNLANTLCSHYRVELITVYSMGKTPAYPVDPRVKIRYLIDDKPNRSEFKAAVKKLNPIKIIKEGIRAARILYLKDRLMIKAIKALDCDAVLSTRAEYAFLLSKYAPAGVNTITQEHLHNDSEKYVSYVKNAFSNIDRLVVLCPWSGENFSRWLSDNKKIEITEIPNILNVIPSESAALGGFRIVSAGRLHPVKNFSSLIRVFAKISEKIPEASLTIVGGGEEEGKLKAEIKKLGLEDRITVTGMVSADKVREYMLSSDIYLMTSHTECFPMVLLEASSVGLPLISYDVPVGPRAIIAEGENGYLIPYGDETAMADKAAALLSDRETLLRLGKRAKEMSYNYTEEKILPLWQEILH